MKISTCKHETNTIEYASTVLVHKYNGSLVKRLRRRPLTAETWVRFPYGLLTVIEQPNPERRIKRLCLVCFLFHVLIGLYF